MKSQDRLDTGPSFSSLTVEISTPLPSVPGPSKVKFQQRYQNSHRIVISGIVECPLDADSLYSLLIRHQEEKQ